MTKRKSHADVLIVTALKDELDVILEAESDWRSRKDGEGLFYYTRQVKRNKGNPFSVAVAPPADFRDGFGSDTATRLVRSLGPRCLSMVGICAGLRGQLALGDVVVAERVFRYDSEKLKAFQEGKIKKNNVFQDIRTCGLSPRWVRKIKSVPSDWTKTIKSRRPFRVLPDPETPKVHVAPMGTGNHVRQNPELFPMTASHIRKVLEVDAEAVAIGAVPDIEADVCIIVKAVADQANDEGNEHLRFYAIETSYRFLMAFLKENLPRSERAGSGSRMHTPVRHGHISESESLNAYILHPELGYS